MMRVLSGMSPVGIYHYPPVNWGIQANTEFLSSLLKRRSTPPTCESPFLLHGLFWVVCSPDLYEMVSLRQEESFMLLQNTVQFSGA